MSSTIERSKDEFDVNPYWRHQMSIASSLAARLAKAKSEQNLRLVVLLNEEEKQAIQTFMVSAPSCQLPQRSLGQSIARLFGKLQKYLFSRDRPCIEPIVVANRETIWQGYDPKTGDRYCCETEAEIIDWLETITYQPPTPSPYGQWGGISAYRQFSRSDA
jgi:hypothetical protein